MTERKEAELVEARGEIERWAEQALKEEDCRKGWQAERDSLAADNARLEVENATLRMHAEARAILTGKE